MYGFNPERTRFLPAGLVNPPFRVKWRFNAKKLVEYSPIIVDDMLYGINNNGEAFALDKQTGRVKWRREIATRNASAPAYFDGKLYFSNLEPGQVQALDAETGRRLWRRSLPGPDRVLAGGRAGQGRRRMRMRDAVRPRPEDGPGHLGDRHRRRDQGSPRARGGHRLRRGIRRRGRRGASQRRRGQVERGLPERRPQRHRQLLRDPDRGLRPRLHRQHRWPRLQLREGHGHLAWSQSTGDYVYAAAVAADTTDTPPTVYVGSYDGSFYAMDARSGDVRWEQKAGGSVSGAASLIGHIVYVANIAKTRTIGFNIVNGKRVFAFRDGAYNPIVSDGRFLYLTGRKQIYALTHTDKTSGPGVFGRVLGKPQLDAQPPRQQGKGRAGPGPAGPGRLARGYASLTGIPASSRLAFASAIE